MSQGGSRDHSLSPSPDGRLRKAKSTGFLKTLHRNVSLKNLRASLGNVLAPEDMGEHHSLRTRVSSSSFQPELPLRKKVGRLRRPGKGSAEQVPPVPSLRPPDPDADDSLELVLDLNLTREKMDGIVHPDYLESRPHSPDTASDIGTSSVSQSNSDAPVFSNPFPHKIRSIRSIGTLARHQDPTHTDFLIPPSWLVEGKVGNDAEEESSSDEGEPSRTIRESFCKIRIYGPDHGDHVLAVSTKDTVLDIIRRLDAKLPPGVERDKHELYLKERGRERILRPKEHPANILRRRLLQAGYDETDEYELGMTDIPFLLKFVYRRQYLGKTDEELSFNNFEYVNLTGRGLGTIPVALHQHADSILSLRLSRNPMIDIPLDFIQSCTGLSKLYLSHMALKKVPQSICDSPALNLLDLSSNRISTLDDSRLDGLGAHLTALHVQNNCLERLPPMFSRLRHLTVLNLSNNNFTSFPLGLPELSALAHLDISFNTITELPPQVGRLVNLESLVIVATQISALPAEMGNLTRLRQLDCRRNQIVDLRIVCALPALTTLCADHNNLHSYPLVLGESLLTLDMSHNDITEFTILGQASFKLTTLDMSYAKLSFLDPHILSQLGASLRTLRLDHNSFHSLPDSLGNLTLLETLSCADNVLATLPESIGRLQKLEFLDVHSNSLVELPATVWNCASLSRLNATSNLLNVWHDPPPLQEVEENLSPSAPSARRPSASKPALKPLPDIPPLAHSLEMLYLGENALTDDMLHPLMILKELKILNLSFNQIQEMPSHFFRNLVNLEEVFLSGNRLTHFPSEDLPRLTRLSTLFLNGNHLQHLPHELGKVKSLARLDVGNNQLKYNINNLDYDWNWNFNPNLMYLNLSGNKQLQIKSDVSIYAQRASISSINLDRRPPACSHSSNSSFSRLNRLRVLGLIDVTITTTSTSTNSDIPDETDDRRVRTSSSLVNGMLYGIADTLGRNHYPLMMDLVHEFRGGVKKDVGDGTIFAMFGRSQPASEMAGNVANGLAKYLKDNFVRVFAAQLGRVRREGVSDALRRTFLRLNQDFHATAFGAGARKMSVVAGGSGGAEAAALLNTGASGIVVYIVGKKMYVANAGNALAIVSRGETACPVSQKHEPYDPEEMKRIRAAEGWISPPGRVNDELDISRSFGFYHLLPSLIARPYVHEYELTDRDDMVIIANRGLWDYVNYQTAVDLVQGTTEPTAAAQKLRDLAISYGAEGSTMVMVVQLRRNTQISRRTRRPVIGVVDRALDRLKDEVSPPTGHVAIVFTDIKGSTHLWEATPLGMFTALHLHNALLRRWLRICGGYEVRTEGDSFMCTFPTVFAAVWWCLVVQDALLEVAWPQDILECADGKEVYDSQGRLIYGGLSVRIGIHCGSPLCVTDPVTNRMDYFGLVVTRAARIASIAAGGQILLSADVLAEINAQLSDGGATDYSDAQPKAAVDAVRRFDPVVVHKGEVKLKGLEEPEMLSVVLPGVLIGRHEYKEAAPTQVPETLRAPSELDIRELRELARLCVRLEMASSDEPRPQNWDGVLLPANVDMPHSQLVAILHSLLVRIENVETVLRSKQRQTPLASQAALLSALRGLDERTLNELWSKLH
ncbi:adenylate cyclase [Roridomyces roridus]|uniref:Adenylate cyclase n=1 Tax=Roridomyces roridus TaxID=1738132 RepID=A0AAD7BLZ8_9AGAR|nr:adenylate cyclase [Roridomyces roridus]